MRRFLEIDAAQAICPECRGSNSGERPTETTVIHGVNPNDINPASDAQSPSLPLPPSSTPSGHFATPSTFSVPAELLRRSTAATRAMSDSGTATSTESKPDDSLLAGTNMQTGIAGDASRDGNSCHSRKSNAHRRWSKQGQMAPPAPVTAIQRPTSDVYQPRAGQGMESNKISLSTIPRAETEALASPEQDENSRVDSQWIGRTAGKLEPPEHREGRGGPLEWLKDRLSDTLGRRDENEWELMDL